MTEERMPPALEVTDADRRLLIAVADLRDHDEEILAGHHFTWEVEQIAAHRTRAHTEGHAEGYEAAVRDVVAWLREAIGDHFADLAEKEFKP